MSLIIRLLSTRHRLHPLHPGLPNVPIFLRVHPPQTELADLRRELDETKASLSKTQKDLVGAQAEVTRLKALEEDMQDNKKGKKDTVGGDGMSLRD